ncbi:MAG TPA: serine hydrolase domain-containing protein [Streptosporangiaceae bacterium]|nr:serine hydrolase domain-containing protein [Streptosporangiaceae bacterium]
MDDIGMITVRETTEPAWRRLPGLTAAGMPRRVLGAGAAALAVIISALVAAGPAVASVPAGTPAAQATFRAALQRIVDDGVPGVIGLARRGDRLVTAASGLADVATGRPMTTGDRVRVGSLTKTMVSTVVLQLVAEDRLRLSDSVARWLPGLVPGGGAITLRELLQHTSGIFDYTSDPGFLPAVAADPARVWRPAELVRIAVAHPPLFPPGTSFAYSNTDYILLGLVVEAATGEPLGSELQNRIFIPLGLRGTSLPYDDVTLPGPYAHGYLLNQPGAPGPVDVTAVSPSIAWAAGGIVSTAGDLARFYSALLTGRLLPPSLLRQMLTTAGVGYGLGIYPVPTACGTAWGHTGDFPGYNSYAFTTRSGGRQAIVLINADLSTLSAQQKADIDAALFTGLCGKL